MNLTLICISFIVQKITLNLIRQGLIDTKAMLAYC